MKNTDQAYQLAKERYAAIGVDTERALNRLEQVRVSFNAWQFDDVKGFLNKDTQMSGGILSTGSYPGAASIGSAAPGCG